MKIKKSESQLNVKIMSKILLIGCGGLATKTFLIWQEKAQLEKIDAKIALLDTHANQFERLDNRIIKISANSHGAGGDFDAGVEKFQLIKEQVKELIQPYDLILILAGLGGGTGSSFAVQLTKLINEASKKSLVVANTLKLYEAGDEKPEFNFELSLSLLNSPYTLINSQAIENDLNDLPTNFYESFFANHAFNLINSLAYSLLNSGIDLADLSDKVFLKAGEVHFGLSTNPDVKEAVKEITDCKYFNHNLRYAHSYALLHSQLTGREFTYSFRTIEQGKNIKSKKIDEINLGQKCLIFFASMSFDQTLTDFDQKLTETDQEFRSIKTLDLSQKSGIDRKLTDFDRGTDRKLTELETTYLVKNDYLDRVLTDFDQEQFLLRKEVSRDAKASWLNKNERIISKQLKIALVASDKPLTGDSIRRWLEKNIK